MECFGCVLESDGVCMEFQFSHDRLAWDGSFNLGTCFFNGINIRKTRFGAS